VFQRAWRCGVPVVVRRVRKGFSWEPSTLGRACREKNTKSGYTDTEIEARALFPMSWLPSEHTPLTVHPVTPLSACSHLACHTCANHAEPAWLSQLD
jgi:hypothetical protein